jgi:hypothetical protein
MKVAWILGLSFTVLFVGCGKKSTMEEPDGRPVSGNYGEAGVAGGGHPSPTNSRTNLLESPSNKLHRVAE